MFDPVAAARAELATLADEDRAGWGPSARADRVRDLFALKERTDAALLAAVSEWDTAKDWALDGQLSAPTWLAWQTPVTKTVAGRVVADAEFLRGHDDIAGLLAAGALCSAHVTAMARAAKGHETEFAICKESLVGSARQMNPTDFAAVMAGWAKAVDDRPPRQDDDRGFAIRKLMDGWGVPVGLLDPELCALLERCFKDLAPPDPLDAPDGPRTALQRGHDALADLARRHLRGHKGEAPATTADVSVDLATLARHRFADCLLPEDRLPHDLRRNFCEIDRRPLSVEDAERLLCDSAVGRLILDADGEVLDAGRELRQFNRAQRRAMARRDGGCAFPGCDRPPEWCDAHHLDFWDADHGDTDLDRGCLLCRRHHTLLHKRGWSLDRDVVTGIFTATAPDGRTFTNDPRSRRADLQTGRAGDPSSESSDQASGHDPPPRRPARC